MRRVALFGAGYWGQIAYESMCKHMDIICFIDNNPLKQGTELFGIPIFSPERLKYIVQNNIDVIITSSDYVSIEEDLERYGIDRFEVWYEGHIYKDGRLDHIGEKRCSRCIMDNHSDKTILFDDDGNCNYCTYAYSNIGKQYLPDNKGKEELERIIKEIKENGKGKKYDCIMGFSGGLDSSYLGYLGYKWGLRTLVVHIDDGFDTDISKSNLAKLIHKTGFDYEVIKPDSKQFNDLTLAYMKAGVPNIAVPQDNVLFAFLYKKMQDYNIKYFLSGGNFSLECILQKGNTYTAFDVENIFAIHNKFGTLPLDKLEFISREQIKENRNRYGMETYRLLNYIDYNKNRAFKELSEFCGFEYYGSKHLENILTAFIQLYWFPVKFDVDKRTSHLSSMIVSGQITRDEALEKLREAPYDKSMMDAYLDMIKNKLEISDDEFKLIMKSETHQHEEYS